MEYSESLDKKLEQEIQLEEERFAAKFKVWCRSEKGMMKIEDVKKVLINKGVGNGEGCNA